MVNDPASEVAMSSGGTASEIAIPGDDTENVVDGGPLDIGRLDIHLKAEEVTISVQ